MKILKCTIGTMIQTYDSSTKQWVGQTFSVSDEPVLWLDDSGNKINMVNEPYLSFDQVDPPEIKEDSDETND